MYHAIRDGHIIKALPYTAPKTEEDIIITSTEIELTLYYLQRVIPRGKEEENELVKLIQNLSKHVKNNII